VPAVVVRPEDVERHFKDRLPSTDPSIRDVSVRAVRRMPRGVSRETWEVEADVGCADGTVRRGYVIRRNLRGGTSVDPVPLRFEYDVYARLAGSPVPVARPLWFDEHGLPDGHGALYVRERVDGDWRVGHFDDPDPRWDELRIATAKEHLRHLAKVHTCDYVALGLGDILSIPPSTEDCAATVLRYHEQRLRGVAEPTPVANEALARLHATAPAKASSIGLCKGTNGLGEEIFRDGRIVAMSDWELAVIGDPAYDWAQIQQLVPLTAPDGRQIWSEEQALAYYESVSGIHIEPATLAWYRALNSLIKFTYTSHASRVLRGGVNRGVRMAWTATEVYFRSQLGLAAMAGIEVP